MSSAEPQPAISATDLRRTFGHNEAVAGIDLAVAPGEIYGFLGPNGAGKSTTVRMLCTLLRPTGGHATGGRLRRRRPSPRRSACASASPCRTPRSTPKQTGRELLRLQGRLYGLKRGADRRTAGRPRRSGRHRRCARRPHRHVLGRHEPPARPRRRADPQPRGAVPRRADHRSRPDQSGRGCGTRCARLNARARHDDLPHHAVPRGGRRARPPRRDHQRRARWLPRERPRS